MWINEPNEGKNERRCLLIVSRLRRRAYCIPQRSSYLVGVSYMVSVFNPR